MVVLHVRASQWLKDKVTRRLAKVKSQSESKNIGKTTGPPKPYRLDKENG